MYFNDGWAKVELGLARGKKEYDKRQAIAERDADREIARALGRHLKGVPAAEPRARRSAQPTPRCAGHRKFSAVCMLCQ